MSADTALSGKPQEAAADAPVLLSERRPDGVAVLTLNRPRAYNALSEELLAALTAELESLAADESLRCLVLAANGKAFCAGHDLKQMRSRPEQDYYRSLFASCSRMMQAIVALPVPVIARVQGMATAAGCQLVATCDLAVADEEARFATSGINAGLFCSTPAVALTRNVPIKPAFEMLVTGDFIPASEAWRLGLINRAVPAAFLDAAVEELVGKILSKSPVAVRTGKRMVYEQLQRGLADAYGYASEVMACNMMAEDAGEGIDAFIEKRHAVWKGR
ncbi:Enoyl-CoA hydratase [Tistlia consotensis]|uniref:Enoyl-CoA hydratase domain-containing protein 3, mitochondrial n=1 Tax=Tistlia consotensis USBA 355 TaxID=560819 RepID=A0A1Y6CAC7_9PROT|nr:enoyl-CoA hydratase [Tistlia consotensis]SMF54014.1 Enoyl-CoA hydratase [Tistlia consotensis USBA 355]SNR86400.1 Enoyl-CoA hydratase [Tistlia consotensis]